ncbi:MAG: hypothetical protein RL525_1450 [Bacteroidota bacterium]|jgi:hypothetical protein
MFSSADCNNCEQNRFWLFRFDFAKITILDWRFAKNSHFLVAKLCSDRFVMLNYFITFDDSIV